MTAAPSPWLAVAHLVRPQGRKGELLAELLTEFPDRFGGGARIYLAQPGFDGPPEAARVATVTSFWLPKGKQAGRIVLGLDISQSIGDAERLAGNEVLVPSGERRALDGDAVYIDDLIGCLLLDGSERIGTVEEVLSINSSALGQAIESDAPEGAPVLVVRGEDGVEYLIPFARAYLRSVYIAQRRLEMELPKALLEIYRPGSSGQKR